MKSMKRLLGLLCCIVLLTALVPAIADEYEPIYFKRISSERVIDLSEYVYPPEEGTIIYKAKLNSASPRNGVSLSSNGVVTLDAGYTGNVKVTLTVIQVLEGEKNVYSITPFAIYIYPSNTRITSATSTKANKVDLKWRACEGATGYEITYYSKKNMSDAKVVEVTGTSATIRKLKAATTYYFTVAPLMKTDDVTLVGDYCKTVSVKVYPTKLVKSFNIQVKDKIVNFSTVRLKKGKTITATATNFKPKAAQVKAVTWESSDTSIATISSSGVIKGRKTGECCITAASADGGEVYVAFMLKVVK